MDIKDTVKTCKVLLLDVEGTTTSISFVKDKLFPYVEDNVKKFLEDKWDDEAVKTAVTGLRNLVIDDKEKEIQGLVEIPAEDKPKEEQIEGLVKNVKWQMSLDRKTGALKTLQGLIWKQGYESGDIKGHIYDDVPPALEQWKSVDGQKVYIYSSGSVQAQKLLFGQTESGDMLKHIDGHFDTEVGPKRQAGSYKNIVEKLGCKADEVLFLTDIYEEAQAARAAGLHTGLVVREGNGPLPEDAKPRLHSFTELALAKKRKTDAEEEHPAKLAKTTAEENVTTAAAVEKADESVKNPAESAEKPAEVVEKAAETIIKPAEAAEKVAEKQEAPVESEKNGKKPADEEMEVDGETAPEKKTPEEIEKVAEIVVEEVTNPVSPDVTVIETVTPTIVEVDSDSGDKMDVDSTDNNVGENVDEKTIIEELPATEGVISENIQPVVEEPNSEADIAELKNVGEVLERECDDILSKVNDITNLNTIPVKPMMMEDSVNSVNGDSNDIVESILDKALEMEQESEKKAMDQKSEQAAKADKMETDEKTVKSTEDSEMSGIKSADTKDSKNTEVVTESSKEDKVDEVKASEDDQSKESETVPEKVAVVEKDMASEEGKVSRDEKIVTENGINAEVAEVPKKDKPLEEIKPIDEVTASDEVKPVVEGNTSEEVKSSGEVKPSEEVTSSEEVKSLPTPESKNDVIDEKKEEPIETDNKPKEDETKEKEEEEKAPAENGKHAEAAEKINGNSGKPVNGDAKKDEKDDLESRLTAENENGTANGKAEDNEATPAIKEIKVKSVVEVNDDVVQEQPVKPAGEV